MQSKLFENNSVQSKKLVFLAQYKNYLEKKNRGANDTEKDPYMAEINECIVFKTKAYQPNESVEAFFRFFNT